MLRAEAGVARRDALERSRRREYRSRTFPVGNAARECHTLCDKRSADVLRDKGVPMKILKLRARLAVGFAAAVFFVASVAAAGPAAAASSPEAACGAGYYAIDHGNIEANATVWLMYNGSTDCVVTWKTAQIGTPTVLMAAVGTGGNGLGLPAFPFHGVSNNMDIDAGSYSYYAGPVYWYAPHTCIYWYGSFGGANNGGSAGGGPSHCG